MKGAEALTEQGSLIGTPQYMAPEQLNGKPATSRSDLFALGAVLYECATGQRAFYGRTEQAILTAVRERHPPQPLEFNTELPAGLSDLIMRFC